MTAIAESTIRILSASRGRVGVGGGVSLAFGFWAGRQPPIVGIHGITASHVHFIGPAERLAGRHGLLAVDLRGRGDSDKPDGPYGMQQHADDVAAVMRAFGLGPTIVVGHSMGAYVGAALAASHPELVSGLVLFDGGLPLETPADVPPDEFIDRLLAPAMARLRTTFASRQAYLAYWRALPTFPPEAWSSWVEAYFEYDLGGEPPELRAKALEAAVRADWADMIDRPAALARLRSVKVPVLVLRAEHGMAPGQPPILPESLVRDIREAQPTAEVADLPGTTHYTCVMAEPGVSQAVEHIVGFARRVAASPS